MNFRVDFTSENILPDGNNFGYVGEHNASTLVITPPKEITDNTEIIYVCLACEVGREFIKAVVRSELYEKSETIIIPLWQQATVSEFGKLQLEGYDGNDNILIKSQLVDYSLNVSANGVSIETNTNEGSLASTVAKNSKKIDDILINGSGKVKKIFIPIDPDYIEGMYVFLETYNMEIYVTNRFLEEHCINEICPIDLTILWDGNEMSMTQLNKSMVIGNEYGPGTVQIMSPKDIDNNGIDKLIGVIYNTNGYGDNNLFDDIFASSNNSRFGGVYLYYFDKIEVVV